MSTNKSTEMAEHKPKDVCDKLSSFIEKVIVPIVVVVVASLYTNAIKESEISFRYIELAIGILRSEPTSETQGLRAWAVEVLDKHTFVPLDPKTKQELLEKKIKVVYPTYSTGTTYDDARH